MTSKNSPGVVSAVSEQNIFVPATAHEQSEFDSFILLLKAFAESHDVPSDVILETPYDALMEGRASVKDCVTAARQGLKGKAIFAFLNITWNRNSSKVNYPAGLPNLIAKYAGFTGRVFIESAVATTSSSVLAIAVLVESKNVL